MNLTALQLVVCLNILQRLHEWLEKNFFLPIDSKISDTLETFHSSHAIKHVSVLLKSLY